MSDDLRAYVAQQRRWRHPRARAQGRVWRRRAVTPPMSSALGPWTYWAILRCVFGAVCGLLLVAYSYSWLPATRTQETPPALWGPMLPQPCMPDTVFELWGAQYGDGDRYRCLPSGQWLLTYQAGKPREQVR